MGLLAWFRRERQWHRDHVAAFSLVTQKQADGLTLFQHQAIEATSPYLDRCLFKRAPMDKEQGDYLVAPLGNAGAELYIYPNDAAIFGAKPNVWFEEWDYSTPAELIRALVKECTSRAT